MLQTQTESDRFRRRREKLVEALKNNGYIRSQEVYQAMLRVHREDFVSRINREFAYADRPLQIKGGQTISAPHMVAEMCEVAELKPGHKVLEIGAGSGYHAAVMAEIVGPGIVYTTEVLPSLVKEADDNLRNAGIENVVVKEHDGSSGLKEYAPFDRIIVTCASPGVPNPLVKQLAPDGLLVIPVGNLYLQTLTLVRKNKKGKVEMQKRMGCVFVPMKGKYGFSNKR